VQNEVQIGCVLGLHYLNTKDRYTQRSAMITALVFSVWNWHGWEFALMFRSKNTMNNPALLPLFLQTYLPYFWVFSIQIA